MEAAQPQNEAARSWALVEPPNVLHRVTGRTALDALARAKGLDVGNVHIVPRNHQGYQFIRSQAGLRVGVLAFQGVRNDHLTSPRGPSVRTCASYTSYSVTRD